MTLTQEYNLILNGMRPSEKRYVELLGDQFAAAASDYATALATVTLTFAERVEEIVEKLTDRGLDEDEISTMIRYWTPTYSANKEKKRKGAISDKYLGRVLKDTFGKREAGSAQSDLLRELKPTIAAAQTATMDYLIPLTAEETKKKKERESAPEKTPIERLANSLKKFNAAGIVEALSEHPQLAQEVLTALQAANIATTAPMKNVVEITSTADAARERLAAAAS